jgi:titin
VGAVTTYSDSPPTTGTSHSFEISAISAVGQGAYSSSVNGLAGLPADPPSLALAHDSNNLNIEVTITNGASMGTGTFTSYTVERSVDGSTGWTSVGTPTTTSFTDTVPNSGNWFYRANTITNHGTSAYSSIVNIAHVDPDLPIITASYYDPNSSDIQVVITNGASFGTGTFTSYSIERSADGSTGWTVVGTPTTSPFIDNTTPNVGDWYYRATTTTAHGTSVYSSNALASPIAPDAPTNLTSVIPSPLTISLDWDSPINFGSGTLTGYEVYRDGSLITTTGTQSQFDDTVSVQGTYVYTVKTLTTHSTSGLSGSTTISTPTQPSADSSVSLSIDNPNQNPLDITVSFVAPSSDGGSAVTGYNLSSSPDDITYTQIATGVTADQTVTVANSGTWYFKSQAINNIGTAALGSAVSITTPTVPTIPTNLVLTSVSNTQIDAVWGAPTSDGGSSLVSYTISLETPSGSGNWNVIATVPASQTTYSFTGLTNDVEYQVGIFSSNNVGNNGNMVMSSEFTRPNTPSNFGVQPVSGDSLYIGWDVNGLATSTFTIQTDYTGSWTDVVTDTYANLCIGNASGFCEYTHTGLDSGSNYNYRVFNTNAGGDSDYSTVADNWTLNNPPSGLTVTTTANTSTVANLAWTAPSGTVTGYQIERESPIGGGWNVIVTDTQSTNVQFDDSPLSLTTEYNYRISAINLGGISLPSNEANITTLSPPDPPVNVTGELEYASGDYRATVSWDAPTNTYGGTIVGYKVERNVEGAGWTVAVANTNSVSTSVLDINLGVGELYEYRISTITQIGTSIPSSIAQVEHMDGNLSFTATPAGGNTIDLDVTFSMTDGIPDATPQRVYVYDVDPLVYVSTQPITTHVVNGTMTKGGSTTFNNLYEYLAEEKDLYLKFTADQGGFTRTFYSSGNQTAVPALAFSGDVFASEIRNSNYTQSTFTINAQPAGYDVLVKYQHQDPTVDPSFLLFEDIVATQNGTLPVVDNVDYYVSVYVNPTGFDYEEVNGVVELVCNDQSPDACVEGTVMSDVPAGAKSSFVVRSERNPDSQQLLGIEGLGDLFGMPMVMLFIIGVGAIFTPRSSQMGIVFIVVGTGLLAYLGYLDFEFTSGATQATWALVILIMLIGIFVGKRWS